MKIILVLKKEGYDKIEVTTFSQERVNSWVQAGYTIISEKVVYN